MRDFASDIKSDQVLPPVVATADMTSASVDMLQFGSCRFSALVGASGDTLSPSVKVEFELQESDDNSAFTAVPDADLTVAVPGTNVGTFAVIDAPGESVTLYPVEYRGKKRFIRAVANLTGTHSNGIPISILADRGWAKDRPVV